jgi:hypothetical protein
MESASQKRIITASDYQCYMKVKFMQMFRDHDMILFKKKIDLPRKST